MRRAPGKWAVGEPMIEWCRRNGLDATRIPDRNDAILVGEQDGQLWATVTYVSLDRDRRGPEVTAAEWQRAQLCGGDFITDTWRVPVDSEPPLTPEWRALFGGQW